jgi:hypothetical protein
VEEAQEVQVQAAPFGTAATRLSSTTLAASAKRYAGTQISR